MNPGLHGLARMGEKDTDLGDSPFLYPKIPHSSFLIGANGAYLCAFCG